MISNLDQNLLLSIKQHINPEKFPNKQKTYTLPEPNILTLKIDDWETILSFGGQFRPIFGGKFAVDFWIL